MVLSRKSYAAGHFLFHLDVDSGEPAYVKSVAGGMIRGAVLEEAVGPDTTQFKHLGALEIDPITIEIGMAMSRPLLDWIRASWRRDFSRRNGSIVHADSDLKAKLEQQFVDALITETTFPTLDGGAKDPAYLTVTIHPEQVSAKRTTPYTVQGALGRNQKRWLPSNFRLDIDGVDAEYVNKIDSFSVYQSVRPLYLGNSRFPELEPVGVEYSNLTVYIATEHADGFMNWYEKFIVRGDKDPRQEREGTLDFLGPDNKEVLFSIDLHRLGIHRLSIERSEANAEQIKRSKIELYLESMDLRYGSGMG